MFDFEDSEKAGGLVADLGIDDSEGLGDFDPFDVPDTVVEADDLEDIHVSTGMKI